MRDDVSSSRSRDAAIHTTAGRLRRRSAGLVAGCLAVALVGGGVPAWAGDVTGNEDEVVLTDANGEVNDVFVNWGNSETTAVSIRDYAGFGTVAGTCASTTTWDDEVRCTGRPLVTLHLGAGDDRAQSGNLMAPETATVMYGGEGNDVLSSDAGSDELHGGPGDDVLIPDGSSPGPGDVVSGGPGTDLLDLRPVLATELYASLDGVANDGRPADHDNYHADIENIAGSMQARNALVGNDGRNVLVGGDLADLLVGGGGKDNLDAGAGNDKVNALDGRGGDQVACGAGADVVHADAGDVVAQDCEKRFYAGKVTKLRHTRNGKQVRALVRCAKDATGPCRGTVRLQHGKKTLLDRTYVVKRGKAKRVTLRTSAAGRKALRGQKRLKVRLLVSSRKFAAPVGVRVQTRRL